MEFSYRAISLNKIKKIDRIQFIIAAITLLVGCADTFQNYIGWLIVIPIVGFTIATLNILMVIAYDKFKEYLGNYFEINAFRLNGIIMMITAIGYHLEGSQTIQYVYYLLAVVYFIVLPKYIIKLSAKNKISIEENSYTNFQVRKKPKIIKWNEVREIWLKEELLSIKLKDQPKIKNYYLALTNEEELESLLSLLRTIKSKYEIDYSENV